MLGARHLMLFLALPVIVAGCSTIVPKDGPATGELQGQADVTLERTAPSVSYALVNLSPLMLDAANSAVVPGAQSFSQLPPARNSTDVRIGTGDLLNLTIFESQAGGLFIPQEAGSRAGNFISVPNQQLDATGSIAVPYAGAIRAVGRTAREVSDEIVEKLKNRAIEPQVVVTIAERRGNEVSVLGDVSQPLRFPLDPGGLRVLGAIARAGGPKDPSYETVVSIQRGSRTVQMPMTAIIKNSKQNVEIAPNDVVYVTREQKVFLAFGATPSPGSIGGTNDRRFAFDNDNMSLSEAVAKAGGLDPTRADSAAVFLFRMESRSALARMGVDISAYRDATVPTIYKADWSRSDAFFLANSFYIRDKDVVFVSEHPTTDFLKFVNIVRGVTGTASDVGVVTTNFR